MGSLLFGAICFGGLFVGWVILPCPQGVRDWWAKHGWAKS